MHFLGGNHRKSLVENLDASLKRLNMSYVDILYVHVYEYRTPVEEIMRSLDDVVRSGKVSNPYTFYDFIKNNIIVIKKKFSLCILLLAIYHLGHLLVLILWLNYAVGGTKL